MMSTMTSTNFRIAAVQMVSSDSLAENLTTAERLVTQAAQAGAQLVLLPEYFCLMGLHDEDKVTIRETLGNGPIQTTLARLAQRLQIWLVGGTLPLWCEDPKKVRNTTLVFNPQGQQVARYDKIHLFSFQKGTESYDESRVIEAGTQPVSFESPCGKVGLSVCYDLRFPELYRALGAVNLILMPAAFTYTTGRAHWELLLRARAVENQCYLLASAQGGLHSNGRRTWGHSMLISPWGEIMDVLPEGEGFVMGEIDLHRLQEIRANLPALQHRVL